MVSLRSGNVVKVTSTSTSSSSSSKKAESSQEAKQKPRANISKKRKPETEIPEHEDKENELRPSTPPSKAKISVPPLGDSELANMPGYERTPGRVGPIKRDNKDLKPDIKPFKGPPGKKVRKTAYEKEQEYKQFCRENEGHTFHELYVCFDKGPKGSPTYDKSGFELDWDAVAHWMEPQTYNKARIMRGMDRAVNKAQDEAKKMAAIFFEKGEGPADPQNCNGKNYWKDRVSKDLNVPWHRITVEHFEQWEKKGFKKARKGEYEIFSEAERERMMRLMVGASLRK